MKHSEHFMAGTGEKLQYLVHDFNDNTIRFVLHYPGQPDSAVLRSAVKAVVERVDVLHSSFQAGAVHAYWHINRTYEEQDYFRITETEGDLMEAACAIAVMPILPEDKTQFRCHLVMPKKVDSVQISLHDESILVVSISHLCVDGTDGKYLLAKLAEAYQVISENGNADGLLIKDGSRKAEQAYEQLSKKEYFSLMRNPIPRIKSVFPYPTQEKGDKSIVTVLIQSEVMEMAKNHAAGVDATVNDLLLTSCYRAYAASAGVDVAGPMSIMSMMDLRKHCQSGDSAGLCNITGSLPTTLPEGVKGDFSDTLKMIAEETKAWKNDPLAGLPGMPLLHTVVRTFPIGFLRYVAGKIYGSMAVGLTNLGALSDKELSLGTLVPDAAFFGGPLKKKPAMQVSAVSLGGACALSVVGEYTQEDARALCELLDRMKREIEEFAGAN